MSNAWDADANNVYIYFGDEQKTIKIVDDGKGMSFDELNEQFLRVGRNRRVDLDTDVTESGRKILGKKGLGKLSMFGIGKKITVTTVQSGIENSFVNETLRTHLLELCNALLSLDTNDAEYVMGYPDDLKLRSCMTLFQAADPDCGTFQAVLDKFFGGKPDSRTLEILQGR